MKRIQGTIGLPGSKSESNRALMIAAYGGFPLEAENLSEAHDTVLLRKLLKAVQNKTQMTVDCEDAGTVSRFMMTYLACMPGEWLLTGTKRLCERPMASLIDALRKLGADIDCVDKEGCLPVSIHGRVLQGGSVTLDTSKSSQFASSLLLAAPIWEKGLQLTLTGETVSEPYINMTLSMMAQYGVEGIHKGDVITVVHQSYHPCRFKVSMDWSAASYWYEMLALSAGGRLLLKDLRRDTIQGDERVACLYKPLGISTEYVDEGVLITSEGILPAPKEPLEFDLSDTPDLFPSILVTCVILHIEAVFSGITTLFLKESDRVNSLLTELCKIYKFTSIIKYNKLIISKSSLLINLNNENDLIFKTFGDHRIAMALAGLKLVSNAFSIDGQDVVNKSYPAFWDEIIKLF